MPTSLYFYDLETSGFSPRDARIMQFAGQRVDLDLKPIGEPHNYFIKLAEDTLPEPDAVLLTGITPQQTIDQGISEAAFLKIFTEEIALAGTVFVGFNNIRFDDEFMRFLHYRNFYDAYRWHWADQRSRWDLLDLVRMTRALRPDGIKWPVDSKGVPANRLELLSSINKLDHASAHDALSDVQATIALAKLIQQKQPKLFKFLLEHRDKQKIADLVQNGTPFVYTSGKYSNEFEKTTVAVHVSAHPKKTGSLVYDLRHDPSAYVDLSADKLAELWTHYCKERPCSHDRLPVKTLQYNRCPAVAPLGVLDAPSQKRLNLDLKMIQKHHQHLLAHQEKFVDSLRKAVDLLETAQQKRLLQDESDVDSRLYEGFIDRVDQVVMEKVRNTDPELFTDHNITFHDERLTHLLPLYQARNFPKTLSTEQRQVWDQFRERKLLGGKQESRAARYFKRLEELSQQPALTDHQRYLLEELQLYGQAILPLEP